MGLRVDASGGIVLLSAAPFDETIVDHIRALPDRRYQHKSQAWIIPARREQLLALSRMIAELDELDIASELLPEAAARLRRAAIARLSLRDGAIDDQRALQPRARSSPAARPRTALRSIDAYLDGPGHPRRRARPAGVDRRRRRRGHHRPRPRGTAARGLGLAGLALPIWRRCWAFSPIPHAPLASLHLRTSLQQPRARTRSRSRHRTVRPRARQATQQPLRHCLTVRGWERRRGSLPVAGHQAGRHRGVRDPSKSCTVSSGCRTVLQRVSPMQRHRQQVRHAPV